MVAELPIEFEMSLLLFVALLGFHIASRINQSVVVAEILVGIAIGPSLLNLIKYGGFVEGLAHMGAVILLFVVGLEFQFEKIYKIRYFIIALGGVALPWIGGYLVSTSYGYDFKSSVFIGTTLTATSIAITAAVLKEMGKLKTEAAEAIIGAAVIDDILSLLVLAVSNQVVAGELSLMTEGFIVLKAVLFLVVGAYLGRSILQRQINMMDLRPMAKKYPEMIFIFAMMVAFLYSMVAQLIGLSAIIGAFLAGVCLSGMKLEHSHCFHEGAEYLHIIFASIFFISLGILVDLTQVGIHTVGFIIALSVVAVFTKFVGCYIPARAVGIGHTQGMAIGFGMSPRGEVAMIVGLIGLTSRIISQELYVAVISMSVITTIITPALLKNVLGDD